MREIRMLRATWRGLETWHGRDAVTPRNRKGEATVNTNFGLNRRASPRPYRCAGCGTGATAALVRRRQTKGAATDRPSLTPPRHISTLPILLKTRLAVISRVERANRATLSD